MKDINKNIKTPNINEHAKKDLERLFKELFVSDLIDRNNEIYENSKNIAENLPRKVSSTIRTLDETLKSENNEIKQAIGCLTSECSVMSNSISNLNKEFINKVHETEQNRNVFLESHFLKVHSHIDNLSLSMNDVENILKDIENEYCNKLNTMYASLVELIHNSSNMILNNQIETSKTINDKIELYNQFGKKKFYFIVTLSVIIICIQIITFLV